MLVVLGLPHLVLAHVGAHDRMARGGPPDVGHHVGGQKLALVGLVQDVAAARVLAPDIDLLQPLLVAHGLDHLVEATMPARRSPRMGASTATFFPISEGVDLDVDLLRGWGVGLQVAGDAVVEAHAEARSRSAFWIAVFTKASPCMPIMPRQSGWL